jgi:hypothetical protein
MWNDDYKILVGTPEGGDRGNLPLKWEYNIKMHLKRVECKDVDSVRLAQDKVLSQAE